MSIDIKKRRTELNLTLEQIGSFVGVSKSTVKKWENGYIKNMRRDKILLLAQILNVSPLDFLNIANTHTQASPVSEMLSAEATRKIDSALNTHLSPHSVIYTLENSYRIINLTKEQYEEFLQIIGQ